MDKRQYKIAENYMLSCMEDSAHDREHVYRVLNTALLIAHTEPGVDRNVLVYACLLHDIGRKEQFLDPKVCHAKVGGEKAFQFLLENGYDEGFAEKVRECIVSHRFRENHQPKSLEAKILFDADKLDAAGAMGIARTLLYQGHMGTPLYSLKPDGEVSDGTGDQINSFFQEYKYKLEKLYDRFYTSKGRELARERQKTAICFYEAMLQEVRQSHCSGRAILEELLQQDHG